MDTITTKPVQLVRCDASSIPHPETTTCLCPHFAGYADGAWADAPEPSMTAAETLDPREAVLS